MEAKDSGNTRKMKEHDRKWQEGGAHYVDEVDTTRQVEVTSDGSINTKSRRVEEISIEIFPESYTANSNKELLCLEYVTNFYRQFKSIFPTRSVLFLKPKNECGVEKFVCTTLRPTLLPFRELYEAKVCAQFVAGIMEYEPLQPPCMPPEIFPSPSTVISWRKGDCFDLSNLLASFLIGAGYDAYVVHGLAPKWICLHDESRTICPLSEHKQNGHGGKEKGEIIEESKAERKSYPLRGERSVESQFIKDQQAKDETKKLHEAEIKDYDFDDDDEEDDELEGKRVHAWVLVRAGKRSVDTHYFIESSTGRTYTVKESPYLQVGALWNHQNYWINMQNSAMSQTLYDLTDTIDWEYILVGSGGVKTMGGNGVNEEKMADDLDTIRDEKKGGDGTEGTNEDILDLPPFWSPKIDVTREMYKEKYTNHGKKCILFRKAKLEDYADNTHAQGLIHRLTVFRDVGRTIPIKIVEYFKNRKDKLEYRERHPLKGVIEEHFLPGRIPDALKSRMEILGKKRELFFYTEARTDGMNKREEFMHKKTMDFFQGRDDKLIYRSAVLTDEKDRGGSRTTFTLPGGPLGEIVIRKMTEKFERNAFKEAADDVRKRTYYVQEGRIKVQYHFADGKITSDSRVYHKTPNVPVEVIQLDPHASRPKEAILAEELQDVIQLEKDCYTVMRHAETGMQEVLKLRKKEEAQITLEESIFEKVRDNAKGVERHEDEKKDDGHMGEKQTDYLTPFLQHVSNPNKLTKEEAAKVKDACLKGLKERLLERANIIQTRLDEENSQLAKKQAAFQRSQRENEQETDEEFEKFCSEAMFRIQILEQRLQRHEETALQKYADLDQQLYMDPRLKVLRQ